MKVLGPLGGLVDGCSRCRETLPEHAHWCPYVTQTNTEVPDDRTRFPFLRLPAMPPEYAWSFEKGVELYNSIHLWDGCNVCGAPPQRYPGIYTPVHNGPHAHNVVLPPQQRWRGSIFALGTIVSMPHGTFHSLRCRSYIDFNPRRLRIVPSEPGIGVRLVIGDGLQYYSHSVTGWIPAEAFVADGVEDTLTPIRRGMDVEITIYNGTQTKHEATVSTWLEGEKLP